MGVAEGTLSHPRQTSSVVVALVVFPWISSPCGRSLAGRAARMSTAALALASGDVGTSPSALTTAAPLLAGALADPWADNAASSVRGRRLPFDVTGVGGATSSSPKKSPYFCMVAAAPAKITL